MALIPNALLTDPDIVWESLCVDEDDRITHAHVMERWINASTSLLEQIINRPLAPRDIIEELDGNGRSVIQVEQYPMISIASLTVYDPDLTGADIINVDQTINEGREVAIYFQEGRLALLLDAPIGRFTRGIQNVHVVYRAGYGVGDLALFQEACIEMIQQRWNMLGRNPLEKVRADSINTISTFTLAEFEQLPWMMTQAMMHYRRWGF